MRKEIFGRLLAGFVLMLTIGLLEARASLCFHDTTGNSAYLKLLEIRNGNVSRKAIDKRVDFGAYVAQQVERQRNYTEYFQKGIKFWFQFPHNKYRYKWFEDVNSGYAGASVMFWKNIDSGALARASTAYRQTYSAPLDWDEIRKWEKFFPQMEKEYLNYIKSIVGKERDIEPILAKFYADRIMNFLDLSLNQSYRIQPKLDLVKLRQMFLKGIDILKYDDFHKSRYYLEAINERFIYFFPQYGLDFSEIKSFIDSFRDINNPGLRHWINNMDSLFSIREKPLEFKHRTIDGGAIDLKDLEGKVILIDFWSTSCHSCIARMPAIKVVYDKYKNQGFEVVSACLNYGDELEKIKTVEKKIGADWPIVLVGSDNKKDFSNSWGSKFWEKCGFATVPQLMLLDKNGKMRLLNDVLRNGDFEPIVKQLLAE